MCATAAACAWRCKYCGYAKSDGPSCTIPGVYVDETTAGDEDDGDEDEDEDEDEEEEGVEYIDDGCMEEVEEVL